ncbi:MAG: ATP-binding protein [Candidatus Asgardarchaeia archaeon]
MIKNRPVLGFVLDYASPTEFYVAIRRGVSATDDEHHPSEEGAYAVMQHPINPKIKVLLQIIEVVSRNKIFSEQSSTFPFLVTGNIGFVSDSEYQIAKVASLGYRKGSAILPLKYPPRPRQKIYPAYDSDLMEFYRMDMPWMIHIGRLEGSNIQIYLDASKIITQHIGILGMTGSGKSYFTSVLVEELVSNNIVGVDFFELLKVIKHETSKSWTVSKLVKTIGEKFNLNEQKVINLYTALSHFKGHENDVSLDELIAQIHYPVPVVIVDAHGEFSNLMWPRYVKVKIFTPSDVRPLAEYGQEGDGMSMDVVMRRLNDKFGNVLGANERKWLIHSMIAIQAAGKPLTKENLIRQLMALSGPRDDTKERLVLLIKMAFPEPSDSKKPRISIEDLISPGTLSIIDMSSLRSLERQQEIVGGLASALFDYAVERKQYEDFAAFLIIEEAHRYAPEANVKIGNPRPSKSALTIIATQGRKFRLGLGLVSQRPALISKGILSQSNTLAIFRLLSQADIGQVKDTFGRFPLLDKLSQLPTGQCILLGVGSPVPFPSIVSVKTRRSVTPSESITIHTVIDRMRRKRNIGYVETYT